MLKLKVFMSSKGISKPHELLLFLFIKKKNIIYNEIYNQSRNLPLTHYFKKSVHDSFQTRG